MPYRMIAAGIALVVMLAACGGAAPAGSTHPVVTPASGASATPAAVTTPAPVTTAPATVPATLQQPLASFAGDPELAARFPTQVAGRGPVTNVNTIRVIDYFHLLGLPEVQLDGVRQNLAAIGIDLDTIVYGTATIGEDQKAIEAFRVPGQDASKLIQIVGANFYPDVVPTLSQETIGGKTVTVAASPIFYMYANGDILWQVRGGDAAVFAALP